MEEFQEGKSFSIVLDVNGIRHYTIYGKVVFFVPPPHYI